MLFIHKNLLFLIVFVITLSDVVLSQSFDRFAIHFGLSKSKIWGRSIGTFAPWPIRRATSFPLGIHAKIMVTNIFSIQGEAFLGHRGYIIDASKTDGLEFGLKLHYLDLSVLGVIQNQQIETYLGPYIGFFHSGNSWARSQTAGNSSTKILPKNLNGKDLGIIIGLGYRPSVWLIDLRFTLGLKSFDKQFDLKHQQVALLLGRQLW